MNKNEQLGRVRDLSLILFCLLIAAFYFTAGCDSPKIKLVKIGIIVGVDGYAVVSDGFISGMKELGYVNNKNVIYDVRNAHGDEKQMQQICKAFVQNQVDLIVSVTHHASKTAKQAVTGTKIPVVFSIALAKEGGLIQALQKPGGNITGVRYPIADICAKRFEYLLAIKPTIKRLFLQYKKGYPAAILVLKKLRPLALSKGVSLVEAPLTDLDELEADLKRRTETGIDIDAIQLLPEPLNSSTRGWGLTRDFAAEHELPIAGIIPDTELEGSVFTYNPDAVKMGAMAAPIAQKILNGTPAGIIPVVSPEIHLRINYKRCRELGLTVPDHMLKLAVEIIR